MVQNTKQTDLSLESLEQKFMEAFNNRDIQTVRTTAQSILEDNPIHSQTLHNLGYAECEFGDVNQGFVYLKQALSVNPNNHEYYNTVGHFMCRHNLINESLPYFQKSVALKNDYALGYKNIGFIHMSQKNWEGAVEGYGNAVLHDPENTHYKQLFVKAAINYRFGVFNESIKRVAILCLEDNQIMHKMMADSWITFFGLDPDLEPIRKISDYKDYEDFAQNVDINTLLETLADPFLRLLLTKTTLSVPAFEKAMTYLRRFFLNKTINGEEDKAYIPFITDLAHHCWFNEYAYYITDEEKQQLEQIEDNPDTIQKLGILATYRLLYKLDNAEEITKKFAKKRNKDLRALIKTQIKEPLEEQKIKKTISKLEEIKDATSCEVQNQYEENPYPRWQQVHVNLTPETEELDILVAGCGTGSQSAQIASYYPNARIHNVDLSLSSLAYATRKSKELGFTNLTFQQADILKLEALDKEFDIIFCSGVLHHMKDPEAGLKVLKTLLKPKGKMQISLYSELGRQDIALIQKHIIDQGYEATEDGIRQFRKDMQDNLPDPAMARCLEHNDFYSLSSCRDMFFHVQEHRFTIPQIEKMLSSNGLKFIEFEVRVQRNYDAFLAEYPEDGTAQDLAKWDEFENKHPLLFSGMYNFWVCHKGNKS